MPSETGRNITASANVDNNSSNPLPKHNNQDNNTTSSADSDSNNSHDNTNDPCGSCGETELVISNKSNGKKQVVQTKWISCDVCQKWFHGLCQGLSNTEVNTIAKLAKKGVLWLCDMCTKSNNIFNASPNFSNTQSSDYTAIKLENIERIVNKIAETCGEKMEANIEILKTQYADVLKKNTENIEASAIITKSTKDLLAKSYQINEEEARKNNAIITGLVEDETKTALEVVEDMMYKLSFSKGSKPLQAFRLGKRNNDGPQKRPLKLRFSDEQAKWEFLKRVNASSLKENGIYCKLDESQEVRDQQYSLRKQARDLKSQNPDNSYRVRNLHVQVQQGTSGEWRVWKPTRKQQTTC